MRCETRKDEEHSILELLDDPIARLLMESDRVNRSTLELELTQMACLHAGIRVGEPV